MAFTEFHCQSGGSQLNSGSTNNNTAVYSSAGGNWVQSTRVFTPTDGSTPSSSVNVGDFASIYVTSGATATGYVSRITAVGAGVNGTITVSTSVAAGSAPANGTGTITLKVGGAWKGPQGSNLVPISLSGWANLQNTSSNSTRINLKNDATYSITTGLNPVAPSKSGTIQGYSTTPGDGGRAIIDCGGNPIVPVSANGNTSFVDLIVQNNGTTGSSNGFDLISSGGCQFIRCVANNIRGTGFNIAAGSNILVECEAYSCNKSNTNGCAGFVLIAGTSVVSCIAHDNTGSNNDGFQTGTTAVVSFQNCIADTNGRHGFNISPQLGGIQIIQCDAYNNGADGIKNSNTSTTGFSIIRNCNLIKNGGYGINSALTTGFWVGTVDNCGFGAGTQANGIGQTHSTDALVISGSVTYANDVTPWVDPVNGDFRINLPAAESAGRGAFTQTDGANSGTVGYPDIGAAQALISSKSSHVFCG